MDTVSYGFVGADDRKLNSGLQRRSRHSPASTHAAAMQSAEKMRTICEVEGGSEKVDGRKNESRPRDTWSEKSKKMRMRLREVC